MSKELDPSVTPLHRREKRKRTIRSPFAKLGDTLQWVSWKDEFLPNIMWACLLSGQLDRVIYLNLFRQVAESASKYIKAHPRSNLCHNYLSTLDRETFTEIFGPLISNKSALAALAPLRLVQSLPDYAHWSAILPEVDDVKPLWSALAKSIFLCLDHQSEQSTDIRFFKLLLMILSERLRFPAEMSAQIDDLIAYPDKGDLRMIRPLIRATEMSLRNFEKGSEKAEYAPELDAELFWDELLQKTECTYPRRSDGETEDLLDIRNDIEACCDKLVEHFFASVSSTGVDARLDSSFGLSLYSLTLLFELACLPTRRSASGRIVLRAIVECCITLRYLSEKDDDSIWLQYRNYGLGQTALAYLKNLNLDDAPNFISLDRLELIANEDHWMESKDILIGNWANLNLRKMAEESGSKDLYDRYYDWTSGFAHAHWGAVRDSVFETCINPLHRFHRIPRLLAPQNSVVSDCCKVTNLMLDQINHLYPPFKQRLRAYRKPAHEV